MMVTSTRLNEFTDVPEESWAFWKYMERRMMRGIVLVYVSLNTSEQKEITYKRFGVNDNEIMRLWDFES